MGPKVARTILCRSCLLGKNPVKTSTPKQAVTVCSLVVLIGRYTFTHTLRVSPVVADQQDITTTRLHNYESRSKDALSCMVAPSKGMTTAVGLPTQEEEVHGIRSGP